MIIFIVIVCIIIFGIKYLNNKIKSEANNNIKTNMLMIQAKVKLINGQVEVEKNEDLYIGTKITDLSDDMELVDKIKSIGINDQELEELYIINSDDLNKMGLSEISSDNEYLVNYKNGEIIYIKGIEEKENIVYKLSELIKNDNKNIFKLWK